MLLTAIGINYPLIHYLLFLIEVGVLGWLYKDTILGSIEKVSSNWRSRLDQTLDALRQTIQPEESSSDFSRIVKAAITIIMIAWSIGSILWVSKLFVANFGTVFKAWDAVVSWNTWAGEWFNNTIPSPQRYAQLIPANFSITYSFLNGADIQIFAKSIMPLFTIFTWLLMLDLALEYRKPGGFIGIVILRYMTKKFLGPYIGEGYVDVALLFFAFLTVYTLLKANHTKENRSIHHYLTLGAIFAAGTALTKQNGLLIFVFYPLLAILIINDRSQQNPFAERIKALIKPLLIGLAVLLPWYLLNETRILLDLNSTNVEFLMSAERHSGRSYIERFTRAFSILEYYAWLFPFVLVTLPLIPKKFRQISLITIFPYTIIWAFLFSIFERNLAMVFPFLALAAGLGMEGLIDFSLGLLQKIRLQKLKAVYVLIPVALLFIGLGQIFTDEKFTQLQIEGQKEALLVNLNEQLYAYFDSEGDYGTIMTQYPLEYLPILQDYKIAEPFAIYEEFYENFSAHPETEYFLVWDKYASQDVMERIEFFESVEAIKFLFEEYNLRFYRVQNRETILQNPPNE